MHALTILMAELSHSFQRLQRPCARLAVHHIDHLHSQIPHCRQICSKGMHALTILMAELSQPFQRLQRPRAGLAVHHKHHLHALPSHHTQANHSTADPLQAHALTVLMTELPQSFQRLQRSRAGLAVHHKHHLHAWVIRQSLLHHMLIRPRAFSPRVLHPPQVLRTLNPRDPASPPPSPAPQPPPVYSSHPPEPPPAPRASPKRPR
ncbi:unnamed protein product [Closterium sp. NIES-54]